MATERPLRRSARVPSGTPPARRPARGRGAAGRLGAGDFTPFAAYVRNKTGLLLSYGACA
jgi:hypothetical protein